MLAEQVFTCSKSAIGTLDKDVIIANFEHISQLFLVFSIVDFEQLNISWIPEAEVIYILELLIFFIEHFNA